MSRGILSSRTAMAAAVGGLVLALAGCGGSADSSDAGDDGRLVIGSMTKPASMDPAMAGGGTIPYYQAVYDTLILREADGSYVPMLATEWTWNGDRTALTLKLRSDVTFDDGTPVDAEVVKANLERFATAGGPEQTQASGTTKVEARGADTVVIHLDAPNPALEHSLSDAYGFIANPAHFDEENPFATVPDGTGPYTLDPDETRTGTRWVFDKKDDYWGDAAPDFPEIWMVCFDRENAIANALMSGQFDAAVIQTVDQQIAVEGDDDLTTQPTQIDAKLLNLLDRVGQISEPLGDVRVRQALNYAVDREALVEHIEQGRGAATSQLWGPNAPGFDPELDGYYDFDPDRARELLEDAGYADGFDLELPRLPGLVSDALGEALRTNLADVGINLIWVDVDQTGLIQRTFVDHEFPGLVMNGGQPSVDWAVVTSSVKTGPANFIPTPDPTVDRLSAQLQTAAEPGESARIAQELNRHLVENAWWVPLYRMDYLLVTSARVTASPGVGLAVPSLYYYAAP